MAMDLGQGKHAVSPRMNVTPLVDVVLVLLIIFMVVTPLLTKKFWLHIPKSEETKEEEPPPDAAKPVVLTYHRDGAVKINNQPVTLAELPGRLERIMAARGDNVIFFDAENDADYGEAIQVLDSARGVGAQIAVLTESVIQ